MDSPREVAIVRLAGAYYRYESRRLEIARERFGLGSTAFYLAVNRAIEDPAVAIAEPVLVARLRRQRDRLHRLKRAG